MQLLQLYEINKIFSAHYGQVALSVSLVIIQQTIRNQTKKLSRYFNGLNIAVVSHKDAFHMLDIPLTEPSPLWWLIAKWLMLLMAIAWGGFCCVQDRALLKKHLKSKLLIENASLVFRIHQRQLQLWGIMLLLAVTVAAGELLPFMQPPTVVASSVKSANPRTVAPPVPPTAAALATPPSASSVSSALPFAEITEFNEPQSASQAQLDALKQRYESWLISYYLLERCAQIPASDYAEILQKLSEDIQKLNGTARDRDLTVQAASGSYKELYLDLSCDPKIISNTKRAYDANMQRLRSKQIPVESLKSVTH